MKNLQKRVNPNDTIILNALRVGNKRLAYIPLTELRLDDAYQRAQQNTLKALSREWDVNKCETIQVSYRDGVFYITDGQHRYLAAIENGETHLVAEIRSGLTQEDEARLFVEQNKNVKPLSPYDTFNGNILIGDPVDTAISELCKKYNIVVSGAKGIKPPATLGSLSVARSVVKQNGSKAFDWILSIIKGANWTEETNAYGSFTIRPLNSLYVNHKKDIHEIKPIIIDIFSKTTPNNFKARAQTTFPERDAKIAVSAYLEVLVSDKLEESKITKPIKRGTLSRTA